MAVKSMMVASGRLPDGVRLPARSGLLQALTTNTSKAIISSLDALRHRTMGMGKAGSGSIWL